jgi:hypothetical protein
MTRVLRAARSNEGSVSIVHGSFSAGVRLNFRTTTASIPVAALNAVSAFDDGCEAMSKFIATASSPTDCDNTRLSGTGADGEIRLTTNNRGA